MNRKKSIKNMPKLPTQLKEVLDCRAVFLCLQRIARGIDRFDKSLFLSAFHIDAICEAGVFVGTPEASFDAGVAMHEQNQLSTQHYLTNHTCDIENEVAHAETYFFFVGHNRDDTNIATGGRYIDRLERREDEWRVAFRHTILEWTAMLPTASIPLFANVSDMHLNGIPSRSLEDPSYQRPLINRRNLTPRVNAQDLTTPKQ